MSHDKRFLLGQLPDRLDLIRLKEKEKEIEAFIEKREKELLNMKPITNDMIIKTSVDKIKQMKWIDKIEAGPNNSLRILTTPMACTFVPNIGRCIPLRYIEHEDVLYRIMKYQCLGKYFIIQPDYYIIESNFNIKADRNDKYPLSHVRNVMIRNTYFKGQACHIGNGHACLGELSAAISQARKTGLEMLLMSFEVYLRSINLPDAAGQRYYVLPMGDVEGNVEVWPYVEGVMKRRGISFKNKERSLETYEDILANTELSKEAENFGKYFDGSCENWNESTQESNMKECLKLIEKREPEVYQEIIRRLEKGAVL